MDKEDYFDFCPFYEQCGKRLTKKHEKGCEARKDFLEHNIKEFLEANIYVSPKNKLLDDVDNLNNLRFDWERSFVEEVKQKIYLDLSKSTNCVFHKICSGTIFECGAPCYYGKCLIKAVVSKHLAEAYLDEWIPKRHEIVEAVRSFLAKDGKVRTSRLDSNILVTEYVTEYISKLYHQNMAQEEPMETLDADAETP